MLLQLLEYVFIPEIELEFALFREELERLLEEEKQAKRDEEIVRTLQVLFRA